MTDKRPKPLQRLLCVFNAWSQLRSPMPLKIIGDGPLAEQVKAAAKRLCHVTWLGRRSREETQALMGEATMLIFPSKWYETFGRVAVEAFPAGTPPDRQREVEVRLDRAYCP